MDRFGVRAAEDAGAEAGQSSWEVEGARGVTLALCTESLGSELQAGDQGESVAQSPLDTWP